MTMREIFHSKTLDPMLIGEIGEAFDSPDYLYELKFDGERCLAYLNAGGTDLRNKRRMGMLSKVPELSELHRQVTGEVILDGELSVFVDGKPDFFEIQRRSLTSDAFKIELAAIKHPATFVAFDILYKDGVSLMDKPLTQRKELLRETVRENARLAVSRVFWEGGVALYGLVEREGLEGIVAKRRDSLYYPGKRTKDWMKIKNLIDEEYVVCGYIFKENHVISLVLGQFESGVLTYKGHVTLGVNGPDFDAIERQEKRSSPPLAVPAGHGNERAIWLKPELVCTVSYMMPTQSGGMRHPVFKGLRPDKRAGE